MRKLTQSGLKKKCDKLWGQIIHQLYNEQCLISNGPEAAHHAGRPEAHHLISRSCCGTRHDPRNGVLLCSLHHKYSNKLSPHGAPMSFVEYVAEYHSKQRDWYSAHHYDRFVGNYDLAWNSLVAFKEYLDVLGPREVKELMFEHPEDSFEQMNERIKKAYERC